MSPMTRFTQKFVQLGQSRNFTLSTLMVRPPPPPPALPRGVVKLEAALAECPLDVGKGLCPAGHGLDGFDPDLGG